MLNSWYLDKDKNLKNTHNIELAYKANRMIVKTFLTELRGALGPPVEISTVILTIDHNFFHEKEPIVFETMSFGTENENMIRASRYHEAVRNHYSVSLKLILRFHHTGSFNDHE